MIKYLWFVSVIVIVVPSRMDAGPWPKKAGHGFVQIGFSTIGYEKIYDDAAVKQSIPFKARDNVVQFFGEVGLTDKLTGTVLVPMKFVSIDPRGPSTQLQKDENSGLGDIDLALRYTFLHQGGDALAAQILTGIPVGDHTNSAGLYIGDGEFNVLARLMYGRSFHPSPLYFTADLGFQYRTQEFSHDVLLNVEAGYGLADRKVYLILLISGRESLSNKPTLRSDSSPGDIRAAGLGLLTNNQEFWAINPKVLVKFGGNWGVVASWATAVHGRNVAGGFLFAGGVFYEFK